MTKAEKVFLIFLAILGIAFLMQVNTLPAVPYQPVGPAGFAKSILLLLAIGLVWEVMAARKKNVKKDEKLIPPGIGKWIFVTFVMIFLYCALFQVLGYFTTGFLVLVIYMHFLYYAQVEKLKLKDSLKLIAISLISIGCIYVVFGMMFELWLPTGIFI
ncbi:MAG: hypothetical protein PWP71_534 [Clostridia bacterium]|jgi:hypothetical protein|nr:hypothetical protein [Clostridia bacterium]